MEMEMEMEMGMATNTIRPMSQIKIIHVRTSHLFLMLAIQLLIKLANKSSLTSLALETRHSGDCVSNSDGDGDGAWCW